VVDDAPAVPLVPVAVFRGACSVRSLELDP
jgi:hypothetical protein